MKIIIADRVHENIFPKLEALDLAYDYHPDITTEDLYIAIENYECLIIRSKAFIDDHLLDRAPKLKVVCRAGAGIDNLDVKALEARNIHIINAPEGNRNAVAEHCVGLILNLLNNITKSDQQVKKGLWDREGNRGNELKSKTVGIVGYGHMGSTVADKLTIFGCKILAYDKYKSGFGNDYVSEADMEQIYREADILTIHVPLTEETRYFIDLDFLHHFKKPIYLINTSRGEIISLDTIVSGLEEKIIKGAGLDVLENEKFSSLSAEQRENMKKISDNQNVILTPHVAGWSVESYKEINDVIIEKLKSWLSDY